VLLPLASRCCTVFKDIDTKKNSSLSAEAAAEEIAWDLLAEATVCHGRINMTW
jgi:hypothetical protein